jgi:hypothetical protein
LNHQTTDNSIDGLNCNIILVENEIVFNHEWLKNTVENFQKVLLTKYEIVVFAEIDEFIVPQQLPLNEYLDNMQSDYVTCIGINLLDSDVSYDSNKMILSTKKYCSLVPNFNKTLITKIPLNYIVGFHETNKPTNIDNGLFLVHLHYFDLSVFYERANDRLKLKDSFEKSHPERGIQNKYTTLIEYLRDFNNNNYGVNKFLHTLPEVF